MNSNTTSTPAAELLMLDPSTLELARNVRDTVDQESDAWAELVASIRSNGVLQAVSAVRYADGSVRVIDGQRRTLAAREVGAPKIPVYVRPDEHSDDKAREFDRIVSQIEHTRSQALTPGQHAAGVAEMLDLGIAPTKIAEAVQLKRDDLKRAAKIGKSASARTALDSGQLNLEQAAILGAFEAEGDHDAVTRLLGTQPWNFRYEAQCIIEDRQAKRARDEAAKPYADKGFRVLDDDPDAANSDNTYIHLDRLITVDGDPATLEHVEAQPASWHVWLTISEGTRIVVTETGERIGDDQVDWDTKNDSDAEPAAGLYHADRVEVGDEWLADYYVTDPAAVGMRSALTYPAGTVSDSRAEQARAEADAKEAARNMRRTVIRLNKLGQAAIHSRREWLSTYLQRKTPPASAAHHVAEEILHDPHLLTQHNGRSVAAELLGVDQAKLSFGGIGDYVTSLSAARAQVLTLAFVLACQEARISKDAWRYPGGAEARYLQFLQSLGHQLSQIEEVVTGDRTADAVTDGL